MKRLIRFGVTSMVLLAALGLANNAGAQQFILDSGTPTSTTYPILENSQWFAGEFSATAGETVTELSTYLYSANGNGDNFTFDIYTDDSGAFLNTRNASLSSLSEITATGTFTATGWSSVGVDWVVPTTGDYWLAVEESASGTHNLPTFDEQDEVSATTGTAPALAFAYDTGTQFKTSGASPIGLEVTVATVPEPATGSLVAMAGACGLLILTARKRKETAK